jgi:hypothetical protein
VPSNSRWAQLDANPRPRDNGQPMGGSQSGQNQQQRGKYQRGIPSWDQRLEADPRLEAELFVLN